MAKKSKKSKNKKIDNYEAKKIARKAILAASSGSMNSNIENKGNIQTDNTISYLNTIEEKKTIVAEKLTKTEKVTDSTARKLTVQEIIKYCKNNLGITFNLVSEKDATIFLQKYNYFFRIKQYAENWEKTKSGKYIGLDFEHLIEISTLDMILRKLLLKIAMDIEHFLKMGLVNYCQTNNKDDGFKVVEDFLAENPLIKISIENYAKQICYSNIEYTNYIEKPAVWNFVEMIGFHDFINFYSFYYAYFNTDCAFAKQLDCVRRIRNAAAHNNSLIGNLKPVSSFNGDLETNFALLKNPKIKLSPTIISSCLSVPFLNDFAVMLKLYTKIVTSPEIKNYTLNELKNFFNSRLIKNKDFFNNCSHIKNAYKFLKSVLELYT